MTHPLKRKCSVSELKSLLGSRASLIRLCREATDAIMSIDLQFESPLILILLLHSMACFHLWAPVCACSSSQVLIKWNSWRRVEERQADLKIHSHESVNSVTASLRRLSLHWHSFQYFKMLISLHCPCRIFRKRERKKYKISVLF